jgi:CYTH domain-containing protein
MIEIEKTFLIKNIPSDLGKYKSIKIRQGYIITGKSVIRIRQFGDKFELTKKVPLKENDFSQYEETNICLIEAEFEKLWKLVDKSLEKNRYFIPINNDLVVELNIFLGDLSGLSMAEVEFDSEMEMNNFNPPEWFGRDVTQEDFSANLFLAGKAYEEIKKFL